MVCILPFVFLAQQLLSHQQPFYSPDALRERIQGTVVLSYRIAKDGSVEDIETVSGHPYLVIAAGGNLATWRFDAAESNNEKRRVTFRYEFIDGGDGRSEFRGIDLVRVIAPHQSRTTSSAKDARPFPLIHPELH